MGSKNLKAIVARGTKGVPINDPKALFQAIDDYLAATRGLPDRETHMRYGTLKGTRSNHLIGFNTFRNAQGHETPEDLVDRVDHNWYTNNIGVRASACSPGCLFACNHWHRINGHGSPTAKDLASEWGTRPDFGAANPLGACCDLRDMPAVTHLAKLCNQYGTDTMEIGMGISFLMELWERGIIDQEDVSSWSGQPLALEWGNYRAMEELVKATAVRANRLGEMLAGGVYQAALEIGDLKDTDVRKYANYGKAGAAYEGPARVSPVVGFACAVQSIGAHHSKGRGLGTGNSIKYLGTPEPAVRLSTSLLGAAQAIGESPAAINNSIGACSPLNSRAGEVPLELVARAWGAVTGIDMTEEDLFTAGERIANLQKAFNTRLGLRREDDTLCERWLHEPHLYGIGVGMKASNYLEAAKDQYYERHGWDVKTSLQTFEKLKELGMLDVAQVLEREGAL